MAYQNFIPTVWSEIINRELEKALVFAEDCNRQFEGAVKKQGDSVRILGVGKPTITTTEDKAIMLGDAENVEDTSILMPIKKISYYNFKVDDIDRHTAEDGIVDALTKESALEVANEMDKCIANRAADREAVKYAASAVVLTKANVLEEIDKALERLYENNVSPNAGVVITLPPWMYMLLKQAYTDLDTNNSKMLQNGRVGMYGNVSIKMSSNIYNKDGVFNVMVRTKNALAFANPLTHVEPFRPEKSFSDAVKGFVLYDSKIVRPKELIVMNVKKA